MLIRHFVGLPLAAPSARLPTRTRWPPEETALSIMAEVVAIRYDRFGGRLTDSKGRIHEVGS